MVRLFRDFFCDQKGLTMIEYALIAALIATHPDHGAYEYGRHAEVVLYDDQLEPHHRLSG